MTSPDGWLGNIGTWDKVLKIQTCCGSPQRSYHRAACIYRNDPRALERARKKRDKEEPLTDADLDLRKQVLLYKELGYTSLEICQAFEGKYKLRDINRHYASVGTSTWYDKADGARPRREAASPPRHMGVGSMDEYLRSVDRGDTPDRPDTKIKKWHYYPFSKKDRPGRSSVD